MKDQRHTETEMLRISAHIRWHAEQVAAELGGRASDVLQRWLKIGIDEYERARQLLQPKR